MALFIPAMLALPARASPVTMDEFVERLDHARDLADRGALDPTPSAMDDVREAVGLPVDVAVPDDVIHIDADPFLESLVGSDAAEFRAAGEHLGRMADDARLAEMARNVDGGAIDEALSRAYEGIARPGLVQRVVTYAKGMFLRILRAIFEPLGTFRGFNSALAWAVVVGVGLLSLLVLRRLGLRFVPDRAAMEAGTPRRIDWQALADEAQQRGDLREATRALYHALLAALAARRIVSDDASTTAGECRAAVARGLPDLYPAVVDATKGFERVAYGGAKPLPADVEPLRRAIREAAR
jgi:hypothetical protein